jgi:hypothetical protein
MLLWLQMDKNNPTNPDSPAQGAQLPASPATSSAPQPQMGEQQISPTQLSTGPLPTVPTEPQLATMPGGNVITPSNLPATPIVGNTPSVASLSVAKPFPDSMSAPVGTPIAGAVMPMSYSDQSNITTSKKSKSKYKMIAVTAVALLVLSGGALFGLYLPNTPANVWATGLTRTGKALDTLAVTASDKKTLDLIANTEMKASISGQTGSTKVDGTFDIKFNKSDVDGALTAKLSGMGENDFDLGLNYFVESLENKRFPNVYFKYSGLNKLAGNALSPEISVYEGKWIAIESDYLSSVIPEELATNEKNKTETPTAADIAALANALTEVNNKYIFTTNAETAVLKQKSFVGKEKLGDVNTYHYIVGIDKQHAIDYCVAIVDAASKTEMVKKLSGSADNKEATESAKKSCRNDVFKDLNESDSFDMWIDSKLKIIHKIRVTDEKDKNSYVDIGQNYKGGDEVSLFIKAYDNKAKSEANFTVSSNLKTNNSSGEFVFKSSNPGSEGNLTIKLSATPFTGEIKKPDIKDAVQIKEFLKSFGLDPEAPQPAGGAVEVQPNLNSRTNNRDTKNDIRTLQKLIESL